MWLAILAAAAAVPAAAQAPQPSTPPVMSGTIEVTTSKAPIAVERVPASVTVITGDDLRARGATDLASALELVAGVSIASGGDGGPAGSVPEIWGLREFDAFLLVVDGVPWGGAFNPALPAIDMTDVERIEILRGAAPVMYGATSFSGVIQIIHRAAGAPAGELTASAGSYGSGSLSWTGALASSGGLRHSLAASAERRGFRDDRTSVDRGHILYRAAIPTATGSLRFDVDGVVVNQEPASPHPRTGKVLTPLVPIDANHNPLDSKIDENRFTVIGGYDRPLAHGAWSTTLSFTHTSRDTGRGFLTDVSETDPNANGYRQDLTLDDVYFDTHLAINASPDLFVTLGFDHLYGSAHQTSEDFDYFVSLDGSVVPRLGDLAAAGRLEVKDTRNFSGLYLQTDWTPAPRWTVQVGVRLNRTHERLDAESEELEMGIASLEEGGEGGTGHDSRAFTRGSGAAGVSYLAWAEGAHAVWVYADYRTTFKPAALDFGPDAAGEILEPETATAWEVGLKGRHGQGILDWELSAFQMDMENLVVSQLSDEGLPQLVNAGKQRFKGVELELDALLATDLRCRFTYAYHDPRFTDYERLFDGVPTRIDGNRPEMAAPNQVSTGLLYLPARGVIATVVYRWVDKRFLNQRNSAEADAYSTWSAGIGYRFERWDMRLDGVNLNNARPPVSESEVGDAQYYLLPARSVRLSALLHF